MKQRDDDTPAPGACPALVSLKGLNFDYREGSRSRRVLHGLDLEVARGQCVAIMGRSGSGKSTLLNLISGIDLPASGRIVIQGMDLSTMDERRRTLFRRRHIGFIYQFFNLLPTLTVRENILLPLELNGLPRARADEMLRAVALETRADSFPDSLSGGEQQRVAIARALAHEPLLLLADEPTGNLDQEGGTEALALLERLVRRAGHSLILVTHSTEAATMADRILLLHDGHLIERRET